MKTKPLIASKLNAAYAMEDYTAARQALDGLHRELTHLNPSAARSLAEGLEETLTVHRLHVPQQLRMTLASTNVIESAFSIVETVCRNVKRWHGGDQRERWIGSGLLINSSAASGATNNSRTPPSSGNAQSDAGARGLLCDSIGIAIAFTPAWAASDRPLLKGGTDQYSSECGPLESNRGEARLVSQCSASIDSPNLLYAKVGNFPRPSDG
jgi:Transposase, Mutator family